MFLVKYQMIFLKLCRLIETLVDIFDVYFLLQFFTFLISLPYDFLVQTTFKEDKTVYFTFYSVVEHAWQFR